MFFVFFVGRCFVFVQWEPDESSLRFLMVGFVGGSSFLEGNTLLLVGRVHSSWVLMKPPWPICRGRSSLSLQGSISPLAIAQKKKTGRLQLGLKVDLLQMQPDPSEPGKWIRTSCPLAARRCCNTTQKGLQPSQTGREASKSCPLERQGKDMSPKNGR